MNNEMAMDEDGDGETRDNQAALRNGTTRRLIGLMNNRLHGFVSGDCFLALVLRKEKQRTRATSP